MSFTEEGADAPETETITVPKRRGRPPKIRQPQEIPQKPSSPVLGKMIVDYVLSVYPSWKPSDWHAVLTAMRYAEQHGKHWGDSTRK